MTSSMPYKIDVHSHYLPPIYQEACRANGHANPDGMPYLPSWSPEEHLALMDKIGVKKSILSISSPGCHLVAGQDDAARKLTRECNTYAADLKKRMPDRFGFFASLPLPDVQGSLDEIARVSELNPDGFVLLTNAHGHYLGDERFDPVFDELNRRHALVFIHPSTPKIACCAPSTLDSSPTDASATQATPLARKWPNPMLEFFFDTARIVSNLFMSGTIQRCPNLRIILPHLGGAFPAMLSRWTSFSELVPGPWEGVPEAEVLSAFATRIWFDMAGFCFPGQIRSLLRGVGVSHERLMYGSDYPFTRGDGVELLLGQMDRGVKEMFSEGEIEDLYHRTAEQLLGPAASRGVADAELLK